MVRKLFFTIYILFEKREVMLNVLLNSPHFCNLLNLLLGYFVHGRISYWTINARKIDFKYREDCRLDGQNIFTPDLRVNPVYSFLRVTWQPSWYKAYGSVAQENKNWLTPGSLQSYFYRCHVQFWNQDSWLSYCVTIITIMLPEANQMVHSGDLQCDIVTGNYSHCLITCKSNCVLAFQITHCRMPYYTLIICPYSL